jgi:hypothetical protein
MATAGTSANEMLPAISSSGVANITRFKNRQAPLFIINYIKLTSRLSADNQENIAKTERAVQKATYSILHPLRIRISGFLQFIIKNVKLFL